MGWGWGRDRRGQGRLGLLRKPLPHSLQQRFFKFSVLKLRAPSPSPECSGFAMSLVQPEGKMQAGASPTPGGRV